MVLCLLTLGYFYFYQNKRNGHRHVGLCEDSIEAPDHPILNGVSLRHMIEMTTSGSGSGEISITLQGDGKTVYKHVIVRVTVAGTT